MVPLRSVSTVVVGALLCAVQPRIALADPFSFLGSDALVIKQANGTIVSTLFDEGSAEHAFTLFHLPGVTVPGAQDTVIALREPATTTLSDLVAMKVTGNCAVNCDLSVSFWSNDSPLTSDQFLTSLGLQNTAQVTMDETGQLQDVTNLLFPGGNAPVDSVSVGSDLEVAVPIDVISGESDDLFLQKQGQPVVAFSMTEADPEFDFDLFQNTGVQPTISGLPAGLSVQSKVIFFTEGAGDDPNEPQGNLSDILMMSVVGNCTAGCTLVFGMWSEGAMAPADFLAAAGLANIQPIILSELGHPPLVPLLFPGVPSQFLPFDNITFTSDPPIPEPATITLVGLGLLAAGTLARTRRRARR